MKRILLIPSSDYLGHPFPQRHNHLFERLNNDKEFEVHVIRFNIFGKARLKSNCIIHELPIEFKLKSTPLYYLTNAPIYAKEIIKIIRQESIDIVVAGNLLPPLILEIFKELSRYKIPTIFDLQDYYPTSATGYICNINNSIGTIARGLFEIITQHLIHMADIVTVPGIALALYAKKIGAKRVKIIPNGISKHFLKKYDGKEIREKLDYDEKDIVIGYIGSIEFWLDMKTLIKAIAKIYKKIPIKFLLIGKHLQTNYSHKVKNWIEYYDIEKITTWLDFIPHQQVPKYIAAMDIGTIPFDTRNPTAYYAAPNKLWEYLSQEIMIISTPIPEILLYRKYIIIAKNNTDYINILIKVQKDRAKNPTLKTRDIIVNRTWDRSAHIFRRLFVS